MRATTAMERLFLLLATVLELVRDDKRDAAEVAEVLQVIKDNRDFAMLLGTGPLAKSRYDQMVAWYSFYRKEFGITLNLLELKVPPHRPGFDRLIVVAQGLTPEKIFQAMKGRFFAMKYLNNLDGVKSIRKTDKTYAVWVRDCQEADEELKSKSADDLRGDRANCITLEERLLLEMLHFQETGKHLDEQNVTLCAGSLDVDGRVPGVCCRNSRVCVDYYGPGDADSDIRSRLVIS